MLVQWAFAKNQGQGTHACWALIHRTGIQTHVNVRVALNKMDSNKQDHHALHACQTDETFSPQGYHSQQSIHHAQIIPIYHPLQRQGLK